MFDMEYGNQDHWEMNENEPKCKTCGGKGILEFGTYGNTADDMSYDFDPCPDCEEYERGYGIGE